ncbi:lipid kinase YegS [Grimontia hollisae]|uniref:Probable lipid kinase YegS-like n=2 Tax=Grimontia hollisae TaxID=673 RepID=A0A377J7V6_GRIHO|nr:lipid kinase YegS [Grimontia hollisae]MDF2183993.1 lipid kinase YegS [Grimontia hollisae]STO98591.1 Probable lipid kinase YegS [Grimontia hollisae]STQ75581.1 Probable lipid kinase YegS [Grimontia hollisae]
MPYTFDMPFILQGRPMTIRVLLNGKKAGLEPVRNAIFAARENGNVEVRVTWETGDIERLVNDAVHEGCSRIVAAGGDGTVNECASALMQHPPASRPELAVMPLGTANDFATACQIPVDLEHALTLAQAGKSVPVDCVKANNRYFINVASGGFGAKVTAETPAPLKNFLGGGAYTLSGIVQALGFVPYSGTTRHPGQETEDEVIIGAVCNGRQAGGGQVLGPQAMLNNGMLDSIVLRHFPLEALAQVIAELKDDTLNGVYVRRVRTPWIEWQSEEEMPINLDGEPISAKYIRFEAIPDAIRLVLPPNCPLIG